MYEDGVGVERDHKKALEWFQKSSSKSKAPSNRAMGDIYRDGLVVEKNIPEAIKWYKKAAEEGDATAKTELLKLQLEERAPKKSETAAAPAGKKEPRAAVADTQPMARSVEKTGEKAQARADKNVETEIIPMQGKLRPMPKPKSAKPQVEKKIPEKTVPKPVPKKIKRSKESPCSQDVALFVLRDRDHRCGARRGLDRLQEKTGRRPCPAWSWEPRRSPPCPGPTRSRSRPWSWSLPAKFLKRINADRSALKKSGPAPVVAATPAPVKVEPVAHVLRREYKSLDEEELAKMLAAKNIFDAQRNPQGNFPHRYEIKDAAGLRLIIDRATNLAWTRQQNPGQDEPGQVHAVDRLPEQRRVCRRQELAPAHGRGSRVSFAQG